MKWIKTKAAASYSENGCIVAADLKLWWGSKIFCFQLKCKDVSSACCRSSVYLLNSIGPPLFDAVLGPHIVCVLCKFVHQQLLTWSQFYFGQVQRSRLVTIRHHVATGKKIMKKSFSSVMEAIKGKSSGTSLPTFIALYKSLWQYVRLTCILIYSYIFAATMKISKVLYIVIDGKNILTSFI